MLLSSPRRRLIAASATLVVAAACMPPTAPEPVTRLTDDTIPVSVSLDGKEQYTATYRVIDLPTGGSDASAEPAQIAIVESVDAPDPDAAALALVQPTTPEAVKAFVQGEWDALDPAATAEDTAKFVAMLADNELDAGQFLALYGESKLKLADFVSLLTIIDDEGDAQNRTDAVHHVAESLRAHDKTFGDLAAALQEPAGILSATRARAFFQNLNRTHTSLLDLLDRALVASKSLADVVREVTAMQTQAAALQYKAPWLYPRQITSVTNNRHDPAASLFILNVADQNPDHYSFGRRLGPDVASPYRTVRVGGKNLPLAEYTWRWEGTISLRSPQNMLGQGTRDPNGGYVKDLRPVFTKQHTSKGWKVNHSSTLTVFSPPEWTSLSIPHAGLVTKVTAELIPGIPITFHDSANIFGTTGLTSFKRRRGAGDVWFDDN